MKMYVPYIHDNISLNSSQNEKRFIQWLQMKSKQTFYVQQLFFWKSCHLWDNVEKYGTARHVTHDNTIQCMHTACSITQTTDPHSEYVIIIAFPHQQWLDECASKSCLYIHCLPCLMEVFNWQKMHCFEQTYQFLEKTKPHVARSGEYIAHLSADLFFS